MFFYGVGTVRTSHTLDYENQVLDRLRRLFVFDILSVALIFN